MHWGRPSRVAFLARLVSEVLSTLQSMEAPLAEETVSMLSAAGDAGSDLGAFIAGQTQ